MPKTTRKLAASILSVLLSWPPVLTGRAWAAGPVTVDDITVGSDSVRIDLSDESVYKSFMTANPPRLVIELPDTEYQVDGKSFPGKGQFLKDVRGGQFARQPQMISRVVLDLRGATSYRVSKDGTSLVVTLGSGAAPAQAAQASAAPPQESQAASPAEPLPGLKAPEKTSGEAGNVSTQPEADLEALARNSDVGGGKTNQAPAAPPSGPEQKTSAVVRGDLLSRLPRDLVSLDFDNTDIRDVVKLLAAKAHINIIYGPDVSGTLSLHLSDVPFNEAFRTVLTMMGLTTIQVGETILRVLTPGAAQRAQSAAATATKVIPLNYAKAAQLVTAIQAVRQAASRTGTTIADPTTNSIIDTESPEGLLETERLIAQLDVRPKQVLIEVKLIEVGLTNSFSYGIQWDYDSVDQATIGGKRGTNLVGTTIPPLSSNGTTATPLSSNANIVTSVGANGRGTGVQLPASPVFGALTLGRITNNFFVTATLTAAAAEGKVKVLSDPKVATLNNQPANINVTTSIPYVTSNVASTGVQTQSVSYALVGIQLTVTPTINADGRITLQINPIVSQPSATAAASTTGAPAIDSRNAQTTVLVHDSETIVIGGLISDSVSDQIGKIPILGDIPLLGWLFKKKSHTRTRSELLIFVTPKVMPA